MFHDLSLCDMHGLAETELLQCLSWDNNRYDQPWHRLPIQWSIAHTDEYANPWLVATCASGWQEWCLVLMFMFFIYIHVLNIWLMFALAS